MTPKIKCIILRKNRSIEVKRVSRDVPYFKLRGMLYIIPLDAVNLTTQGEMVNPTPEVIYMENSPLPITADEGDASSFLDRTVIQNLLKQTSRPRGLGLEIVAEYLRSPSKLLLLTMVIIIIITVIGGYVGA